MSESITAMASAPAATKCANCGAAVAGHFCGECGQSRRDLDRSIAQLVRESLDELFRLDGRAFRTWSLLLLRPGAVTADYLAGRRVRYTPPIRLYLLASAAFFIGFRLTRSVDQAYYGLGRDAAGSYEDALANVLILLLPVLGLLLKALYVTAGRPLLHHLIFSLHTGAAALSWALLLTLTAAGFKASWRHYTASPEWLPDFAFWLYIPGIVLFLGYVVIALRRAYGSGWIGAAVRMLALASVTVVGFYLLIMLLVTLPRGP